MKVCNICKKRPTVPGEYATRCRVCLREVVGRE